MRKLLPFIILTIVAAAFAGWKLDILRLFPIFQPVSVILSIMAAAIFVRLNRGMPTIDWKALTVDGRQRITGRMVSIARDYIVGLGFSFFSLAFLVCLVGVGVEQAATLPHWLQVTLVSGFVLSLTNAVVWMGYVIWRDYDIMLLQKEVIEEAAKREQREKEKEAANEKTATMKASSVVVAPTPVKPFRTS